VDADDLCGLRDLTVRVRVWVERAGRAVLGPGRLELLQWIDRCHSISAAARQMGVSYRHAWVLVQDINRAAGAPLVVAAPGGRRGGGAQLTPRGRVAVAVFRDLQEQLHRTAASLLPRLLPEPGTACVHVAAAVSLEEVLAQLLTDYGLRRPAVPVRLVLGASDELAIQIRGGALADLFLTADPGQLAQLEALGAVEPGTATPLAENTLAAIGPASRTAPVRRPADLLGPGVVRLALAAPSCPLGSYTRAYLEGRGLYTALLPRTVHVENSRAVVAAVQAGEADAGLVYSSATATASGCRVLFRVPRPPVVIRYVGAVLRRGRQPEQARDLLEFLASAPARRRFRHCGFLPVRGERPKPAAHNGRG
jgi:molybdate transport system substrate-binding protein